MRKQEDSLVEKIVTAEQWRNLHLALAAICNEDGSEGVPFKVMGDTLKTLTHWAKVRGYKLMLELGEGREK